MRKPHVHKACLGNHNIQQSHSKRKGMNELYNVMCVGAARCVGPLKHQRQKQ